MPIMAPVGDLVAWTRQSTVLAFQLGDGLTNAIYPTSVHHAGIFGCVQDSLFRVAEVRH